MSNYIDHINKNSDRYELVSQPISDSIADEFSTSKTYSVGDYVMYEGQLYKCKTAVTNAGSWTVANWNEVNLVDDVVGGIMSTASETYALKSDLDDIASDVFESGSPGGYAHKTVTELFTDGSRSSAVIYSPSSGNTKISIATGNNIWNSWYVKVTENMDIFFDSSLNIDRFLAGKISNVTDTTDYFDGTIEFTGTNAIRYDFKDGGDSLPTESNKLHINANDTIMISLGASVDPNDVVIYYGEEQSGIPDRTLLNEDIVLNESQMKQVLSGLNFKEELLFVYGYLINVGSLEIGDVVNLTLVPYATHKTVITECKENDAFLLTVHGGSVSRAWCFVDSDNKLLSRSEANATLTNALVIAPQNSARIIICDIYRNSEQDTTSTGGTVYRVVGSSSVLNSRLCYIATDYGISTGSMDNTPALQNLIDTVADNGGGIIFFPNGTYQFQRTTPAYVVIMRSNVSIVGEDSTKTILKQTGFAGSLFYKMATAELPIVGCTFRNFTVDAYETTYEANRPLYGASAKALFFQYVEDCVFEDLILKGTLETALGIDYLNRVKIENVSVVDGGRSFTGTEAGRSGIGIGTGGWSEENFTITDCVCIGCGQYGIFIENQHVMGWGGSIDKSKGQIISNCIIRNGLNNGFGIRGGSNVIVTGCLIYGNSKHGINIEKIIDTVMVSDCIVRDNLQNGITIIADRVSEEMNIANCTITGNANNGIYFRSEAGYDFSNLQLKGNTITENGGNGFEFTSPVQFLTLMGNYTKGNSTGLYISENDFADLIVKYNVFYDYFCNKNTGVDSHFNDIFGDVGDTTASAKGEITNSIWRGKTYISHGDSITWQDGQAYIQGEHIGETARGYQTILSENVQLESYNNQGKDGLSMALVNGNGVVNAITAIGDYTVYDLCTISCGTNDFKLNVPIGTKGQIGDTAFNASTFCGAYRKAVEYILANDPTIRLVLMTPLQRDKDGYDVNYTNSAGAKLIDYVNAIKEIGEMYNLPVCDMYSNSGITIRTLSDYTMDGLHPNDVGYQQMGGYLTRFLNKL